MLLLPFTSSETLSKNPLELIHSAVWGPSPILSACGFKYYIVFIDDFSKYTWLFPLEYKSDVYDVFKCFQLQVENLLPCKIKRFQSDGGHEYS